MISVLLPVRNGSKTLDIALESLRSQRVTPTECVVVDDGSTDATSEILMRWQRDWPVLRVLRTPGLGIARALNAGLELCRYPWIARMDADDRCHESRFEAQMKLAAQDRRVTLVGCRASHWLLEPELGSEGMRRHIEWTNDALSHEELERALWVDSPLPHPTWLVHRRALELVGAYSTERDIPEDYEWLHRFFGKARACASLRAAKVGGESLLEWADSGARLTRQHDAYKPQAFDRVKVASLKKLFGAEPREVFVFGLGPKAKALVPLLKDATGLRAIVDVNPRHVGIVYQGVEVWSAEQWAAHKPVLKPLVLNCVGTNETRANCERVCVEAGLKFGDTFLSL